MAASIPVPAVPAPLTPEGYRTAPDQTNTGWPPGVPYIVGNEGCERFSFYGMRAILYVHLVSLYTLAGAASDSAKAYSTSTTHLFNAAVYALPMIGAILADGLLGKYRTIFWLSLVYCAGHGVLALVDLVAEPQGKLWVMYVGLGLIAVGSGGIKPCVSANVGDQFGKSNWHLVRSVYQIFYFSINFGSFFSTLLIPFVKETWGAGVAFAIPGILMLMATIIFWMGRKKFVHVPPSPGGTLGLLDTISSSLLFLAVGHLFFTKGVFPPAYAWPILAAISLVFLMLGLWVFQLRQRIQPDDSFLAILVYTLSSHISGTKAPPLPRTDSRTGVQPEGSVGGYSQQPVPPPGRGSWFWAPAVERYGPQAVEGPVAVFKVLSVFLLVSVFWALFDQHSSTWIRQAEQMDLTFFTGGLLTAFNQTFGTSWNGKLLPSQIPALNPLMVMGLIPLLNLVYVGLERTGMKMTPLSRMTVGFFFTAVSFVAVAVIQGWIIRDGDGTVPIAWQLIPYLLITIGEVMVSITALEFAYTQAPKKMKAIIMGFFLLTVSLGNVLVAFLAGFEKLPLDQFFWIFAALCGAAGVLFGLRALLYVPKDYAQE
jgi:proton-dependent oligopeptide transporter, POT family